MHSTTIRLPRTYDAARMRAELRELEALRRVPAGYAGEDHHAWESLALLAPERSGEPGAAAALERAPYLAALLEELACPKQWVRLMSLGPGGVIAEHRDEFVSFQDGLLRLHVPVVTHPDVDFFIGGQRCDWKEGELWYGDFSQPHRARNRSLVNRIHLVIDVRVNDFVLGLFPADVIAAQRARGIHLAGADAGAPEPLRRFAFDFLLPAGFVPPGTDHAPLAAPATGRVQVRDGRLIALVDEQPLLRLEPVSDGLLRVHGLAPGTTLECGFQDGRVAAATLVSGADGARLPLRVLPG